MYVYIYILYTNIYWRHVFFTQTAAAPSIERKLAVAVDRTSSAWQEGLEHLSEEFLMRSYVKPNKCIPGRPKSAQRPSSTWCQGSGGACAIPRSNTSSSTSASKHAIDPGIFRLNHSINVWTLKVWDFSVGLCTALCFTFNPLPKFRSCSVSMDVKASPGSASMAPTIKGVEGRMPKTIARTTQPTQRTVSSNCMIIWALSKRRDGCILLWPVVFWLL